MSIDESDILVYGDQVESVCCGISNNSLPVITELVDHMRNTGDPQAYEERTRNIEQSENMVYLSTETCEITLQANTHDICDPRQPLESQYDCDFVEMHENISTSQGNDENGKTKPNSSMGSNIALVDVHSVPSEMVTKREQSKTTYMCEFCGKTYHSLLHLRTHQKDAHASLKLHMCDLCERSFTLKSTLENHRRLHTRETYKCTYCDKKFRTANAMYIHERKRNNCKPYVCTKCEKRYLTKECLSVHLSTHQDNVSYSCDTCGKSFSVKRNLLRHFRVHTTDETFVCSFCPSKFRQKRYLRVHNQIHHPDE